MAKIKSYIICTSPRSGSTLLCRLLKDTQKAGVPDSHFHTPSLESWLQTYGLIYAQFPSKIAALTGAFRAAQEAGTGLTDVFGLRLQRHSFDFFMQQLSVLYPDGPTETSRIEAAFGQTVFIHLTRENKLEQAISYVKASQTGLWHKAADGTELERLSPAKAPVYDAGAIADQMNAATEMDAQWTAWFAQERIEPLRVTYDALSTDPSGVLGQIFHRLGIEYDIPVDGMLPLAKLADATSKDWAIRFKAERGDPETHWRN